MKEFSSVLFVSFVMTVAGIAFQLGYRIAGGSNLLIQFGGMLIIQFGVYYLGRKLLP